MKYLTSLVALASVALAQTAVIGLPHEDQEFTAGSDVVVQVRRPVR